MGRAKAYKFKKVPGWLRLCCTKPAKRNLPPLADLVSGRHEDRVQHPLAQHPLKVARVMRLKHCGFTWQVEIPEA